MGSRNAGSILDPGNNRGLFAMLVGLFGYGMGGIASATGKGGGALFQIVSIAIPIAALVGAGVSLTSPVPAGVLLLASAVGIVAVFGFNFFTAIPCVLTALAGVLALSAAAQQKPASQ
jgi:hypothetical protein